MNVTDIEAKIAAWSAGAWWEREAACAWRCGNSQIIPGRQDADVYLVRFWLSDAVRRQASAGGETIESGDSLLLHYFARGDDDQALHDHPWNFRTTILVGGYIEHLPPADWMPSAIDGNADGPSWNTRTKRRDVGDVIEHRATDLHCVGATDWNTWTLVRTGPRVREWGFHPPGQRWVGYRDFLGLDVKAGA